MMDQNLRSTRRQTQDLMGENTPQAPGERSARGSAMVLVLGFVALVSMAFGFLLGLLF